MEAMGIEPTNLLHAMQALYQLSYAPGSHREPIRAGALGPTMVADERSTEAGNKSAQLGHPRGRRAHLLTPERRWVGFLSIFARNSTRRSRVLCDTK